MGFLNGFYSKPGPGIPKDAPKKKGMALFFDILWRESFELLKLNLLFILFCIPVVTIPAALTAMSRVTVKMVRDENHFLWGDFWETFKKEFVPATLGGGLLIIIMILSLFAAWLMDAPLAVSGLFAIPLAVALAVGLVALTSAFYFFPMQALVNLPLRQMLKNALLLSFACVWKSLLAAAIFGASLLLLLFYFWLAPPILLLFACSLLNLICTFIAYGGIRKYVITPDADVPPSD